MSADFSSDYSAYQVAFVTSRLLCTVSNAQTSSVTSNVIMELEAARYDSTGRTVWLYDLVVIKAHLTCVF